MSDATEYHPDRVMTANEHAPNDLYVKLLESPVCRDCTLISFCAWSAWNRWDGATSPLLTDVHDCGGCGHTLLWSAGVGFASVPVACPRADVAGSNYGTASLCADCQARGVERKEKL